MNPHPCGVQSDAAGEGIPAKSPERSRWKSEVEVGRDLIPLDLFQQESHRKVEQGEGVAQPKQNPTR